MTVRRLAMIVGAVLAVALALIWLGGTLTFLEA